MKAFNMIMAFDDAKYKEALTQIVKELIKAIYCSTMEISHKIKTLMEIKPELEDIPYYKIIKKVIHQYEELSRLFHSDSKKYKSTTQSNKYSLTFCYRIRKTVKRSYS